MAREWIAVETKDGVTTLTLVNPPLNLVTLGLTRELNHKLGELAEGALRRLVESKPSVEAGRRAEELLDKLRGGRASGELLRSLRAVEVLEDVGTPQARHLLNTLAGGTPEARLTREAKASSRRLARKTPAGR